MGDHDSPGTCLSTVPHGLPPGQDVRDILLHYSGCLRGDGKLDINKFLLPQKNLNEAEHAAEEKRLCEDYQRQTFYNSLLPHKQQRIDEEKRRIGNLRVLFENDDDNKDLVTSFRTSLNAWLHREPETETGRLPDEKKLCKENAFGLSAYMMLFEYKGGGTTSGYTGVEDEALLEKFPNQKIPLKELLYNTNPGTNPLMKPCKDGMIRYFHLPGNNMEWIEEAIARHFNEKRLDYDGLFRQPANPSKSYMILRPGFWRGQQHGGRGDAVHARHMRPRCDIISTNSEHLEDSPNNLVLFMPYLHWETDRSRHKFGESMRNITKEHMKNEQRGKRFLYLSSAEVDEQNQQASTSGSKEKLQSTDAPVEFLDPQKPLLQIKAPTEVVHDRRQDEVNNHPTSKASKTAGVQASTGMLNPKTLLGEVLYKAAKLSEAMDCYQEEMLLKGFLHSDPPFHPRRTLDQSYYWTLQSTKKRDRDQVVFRGTAPKQKCIHSPHCKTKKGEPPCRKCWDNIRKVPRVIMVDQLWLWILNGNTIITSFPKRYGRNKPDPSAVHKSIRLRLKVARKNEIRSIYDLALIIIDECSKVFFDRTKTADRQPQMMDLFAEAIGNVNNRTTIYYDRFWDITRRLSKMYKDKIIVDDVEEQAKSLLDINPEGDLSREIKDVLDELHIMLNIKSKQQRVLKDFQKHIKYILAPELAIAEDIGTARVQTATALKITDNQKTASANGDTDKTGVQGNTGDTGEKAVIDRQAEKDAKWTMECVIRLSADLDNQVVDLNHLKESAEHTEKAVDGLLALKQQQAGVVQAREAVRQAEETLRQGRSIMLFTVITIIFLPLSFGTGIFGMNLLTFGPSWTLHKEITYIFFVSTIVIVTSLILGFSPLIRSFLALVLEVSWTWFVTTTRLYDLWFLSRHDSNALTRKRVLVTREWKEEARKKYLKRQDERRLNAEELKRTKKGQGDTAADNNV